MTYDTPEALRIGRYEVEIARTPDRGDLGLSGREWDVLLRVTRGLASPEIADEIGVSRHTVDTYRRRIFDKLDVDSAASAAALAMVFQCGAPLAETANDWAAEDEKNIA